MILILLNWWSLLWGVYTIKEVDKLHLRFETLLGIKRSTPNLAVYWELGRFPFSLLAKQRALKIWIKVMKNPLSPQYQLYNEQCNINNAKPWAKHVHSIIDHIGLRDVRINFNEYMSYFNLFKVRVCYQFVQEWQTSINNICLNWIITWNIRFEFEPYR